jgi:hypothetical protein
MLITRMRIKKGINMIKGRCAVYSESLEFCKWPDIFAEVPQIGSSVSPVNDDKKYVVMKVSNVIHTARYTNNDELDTEPFIIVELEEIKSVKKPLK